ncbi:MAG: hypothetical protein AAF985_27510, partial [Bacteroidota bacterium]
ASEDQIFVDNTIYLYQNFGELYNHTGNYHQAITYLKNASSIPYAAGSILEHRFADHFYELGKASRKLGYFEEALFNFSTAAYLLQEEEDRLLRYKLAKILNSIGVTYWYKKDPAKARIFVEAGQDLLKGLDLRADHFLWTKSYNDLGLVAWEEAHFAYVGQREYFYQLAEECFKEAKKRYIQFFDSADHRYIANIHGNLGRIYFDKYQHRSRKEKQHPAAKAELKRAKEEFKIEAQIRNRIFKNGQDTIPRHPSMIRGFSFYAELYLEEGQLEKAFNYCNLAIHNGFLGYDYQPNHFELLGNINLRTQVSSHLYLQRALYLRAKTLYCFYNASTNAKDRNEYLHLAYQTLQKATKLVLDIRKTFKVNGAILQANAESRPINELFNEVVYTLIEQLSEKELAAYDLEKNQLISQAFDLTERGKAVLLLRAAKRNNDYDGLTKEEMIRMKKEFVKSEGEEYRKILFHVISNFPFSKRTSKTIPSPSQLKKGKMTTKRSTFKGYEGYFAKAYENSSHIKIADVQQKLESNNS